jgi:NADH dehydrogenase
VVAGAGFSGVEAIAEVSEMAEDALRHHPRLRGVRPRWVLVDAAPRILGQTPDGLARFAERTLGRRGIEIVSNTRLAAVDADGVELSDGQRIETRTVVWTAGVEPNPLVASLGLPLDERGRVEVDETLRVVGAENVWSLGDCAAVPNLATPGVVDPPTCQHALRQARRLARNLRGTPKPYKFRSLGHMATLGRRHGIALLGSIRVRGMAGWLVARGYHVLQLPFASRRARVVADWTAAAVFRRDVAELSVPGAIGSAD